MENPIKRPPLYADPPSRSRSSALCNWLRQTTAVLATCALCHADEQGARRGIAATVHPIATDAAIRAFERGGNAIDAAVAAALTLGVVDSHNSGIGGGCFLLIHLSDGRIAAIDGRETAPHMARRDMFLREGKAESHLSERGAMAVAVPGALKAYDYAIRQFGKRPLREHLLHAAVIADHGFRIGSAYARVLEGSAGDLRLFEASRAVFLRLDGSPKRAGELLAQPDLAATYRSIARDGAGWFYGGHFANLAGDWMKQHGGVLAATDLAQYEMKLREPVITTYRGFTIIGFPPPSSGGVHVAQILNILENFDLRALAPNRVDWVHLVAEAMKLAFADRAFWLGDADFAKVPRGLVSKDYAAELAKRIRLGRAIEVIGHGEPTEAGPGHFGTHTTHFSTADSAGNWVACTATINTSFGSKAMVPGTGVVLNNQMDDFSAQPGAPNHFGLIGAEANAVAPRKRPLSSMSPTFVLKDGRPIAAIGAAGGPTIISQVVITLVAMLDFGMSLEAALAHPRFHHQWRPDELKVEAGIGDDVIEGLKQRGHNIVVVRSIGVAQGVGVDPGAGSFIGVHDPRVEGKAAGW